MRVCRQILAATAATLLSACATAPTAKLQRTQDGTTALGRVDGGFRVVAYGSDFMMAPPQGWRMVFCTEQPLDAHVVCGTPDGKQFANILIWDASRGAAATDVRAGPSPEAYLQMLRRSRDRDIQMRRDLDIILTGGRRVPVWRFYSDYWGERLYATLPAGSAVVSVEVGSLSLGLPLRDSMRTLLESYRPNQAMQRTASSPRRIRPKADKAATDLLSICHPSFGCESRFPGLAVADLTLPASASIMIPAFGLLQSSMIVSR